MRVLFVDMPFGSIRPAMGASLLKGHLARLGIESRVLYLNLRYAERHGREFFHAVADLSPPEALIGEWIFSPCLFEGRAEPQPDFLEMLATRFRPWLRGKEEAFFAELRRARESAPAFLDECLAAADWGAYDVVGFTTSFAQNVPSLALARRVKERFPRVLVALGGADCEGAMGLRLHRSFPFLDVVFCGEADLGFPRFCAGLAAGEDVRDIPGMVWRKEGRSCFCDLSPERVRDLDTLPLPEYDDYFEQERQVLSAPGPGYVLMETSRGCWWGEKSHCTFCGLNGGSMAYRAKSATRALEEVLALTARYGTHRVEMVDNILDMRAFRGLLPELERRGLGLDIFYETKANLRRDQVALLRAAGVRTIQPGIESFSTHVLRLMRKGTSALANVQLLKWCRELGVTCNWNLIYGFPGETAGDYEETVALLPALHHLKAPDGCGPVRVDRFSPFFTTPGPLGLCNVRPDRAYGYVYGLPEDEIANLAYYFEHDYADGRDLSTYSIPLHAAVAAWEASAGRSRLEYEDDGAVLTIADGRAGALAPEVRLSGVERALYLFCDPYRSRAELARETAARGGTEADLEAFLVRACEARLLAAADGRYLSLAVPAARPAAHEEARPAVAMDEGELQAMREKVEAWGPELSERERAILARLLGDAPRASRPAPAKSAEGPPRP